MSSRFIIFAHMRSGSTALTHALNEHPDLKVAMEPFHAKYSEFHLQAPDYRALIKDRASARRISDELFSQYNGMKVLDYHLPPECYEEILLRDDVSVIRLFRHNQLQAIVSALIAQQTGIWHADQAKGGYNPELAPLPLDVIRKDLENALSLHRLYQEMIARKPADTRMDMTYEQLYTSDVNKNVDTLYRIQDFLGVRRLTNDKIAGLLTPAKSKLNTDYSIVPNAREIEQALGNAENGTLFGNTPVRAAPAPAAPKLRL